MWNADSYRHPGIENLMAVCEHKAAGRLAQAELSLMERQVTWKPQRKSPMTSS